MAALNELGTPVEEPQTTATRQGGEWRLEGKKVCVPMAHVADRILVPARVGDDIGLFLVSADQPAITLERQDVTNHEPQFVMHLDGALVGDEYRVGELADGRAALRFAVQRTIVGICAIVAGACQEALRITAEYTTERKQFDRAIGTFQAVGQRMADAYIDTQAIELTMLQAATKLAGDEDAGMEVATAKFWASEGGSRVGPRRAPRARRDLHRPRLPDPPLFPVDQAARVHAGVRDRAAPGAGPADRRRPDAPVLTVAT